MGNFLLTRRNALIGGFSSLILPSAAVTVIDNATPLDPWDQVAVHAFALQDALKALPEQWWFIHKIGHHPDDRIHVLNPMPGMHGGGFHALKRPALGGVE